jgi:hypothetical protein
MFLHFHGLNILGSFKEKLCENFLRNLFVEVHNVCGAIFSKNSMQIIID